MSYFKMSNDEKYSRIGLNIAYQRKLKRLTQMQLAEISGISRTNMSNIEAPNMVTPISLEVIFRIADALEVPVETLFKFEWGIIFQQLKLIKVSNHKINEKRF